MEKSPYQRFICANAKNIGPAPWAPLKEIQRERKSHKEGSKEERREGHGESDDVQEDIEDQGQEENEDQGQVEGEDQGQQESKDERTWKRRPVSVNVPPPTCGLTLFHHSVLDVMPPRYRCLFPEPLEKPAICMWHRTCYMLYHPFRVQLRSLRFSSQSTHESVVFLSTAAPSPIYSWIL